jgi:hypothetical protein
MAKMVRLTSANMGNADEADYESWVEFVCENIGSACGFWVGVECERYGEAGDDKVFAPSEGDRQTMREALESLWVRWCEETV